MLALRFRAGWGEGSDDSRRKGWQNNVVKEHEERGGKGGILETGGAIGEKYCVIQLTRGGTAFQSSSNG